MKNRVPLADTNKTISPVRQARAFCANIPILYKPARRLYRLVKFCNWRIRCMYRSIGNNFNFDTVYLVNTDDITLCTEREFNSYWDDGRRLSGDWDRTSKKFNELDIFIAFVDHFRDNIEWDKTQYYQNTLESIGKGRTPWRCRNEHDLIMRFNNFDSLYRKIKTEGYKTQTALSPSLTDMRELNEISINLDRDGNLLFNDSAHRLAIAKILGIRTVPVRVTVCHEDCRHFDKLSLIGTYSC